jgi:hypothetical protein
VGRTYSMQHCQLGRSLEVPGRLPPPFLSDAPIRWSTCKGCYASIASTEFLEVRECEQQGVSATVKLPLVGIYSSKEVKSIAVYCFTQSIQPGKRDDARAIFEEIRTSRRDEYESSRKRLGIREERVWFQSFPDGEITGVVSIRDPA